ncbi:hypothetical protein [Antribacter gilvus]|uniref:hypothetical protein n=1 Tax=Antribacter gilvus TaxID=2304675 RepID=UPI000F7A4D98|nr:hypothetical protein [Antribacter gilvus]
MPSTAGAGTATSSGAGDGSPPPGRSLALARARPAEESAPGADRAPSRVPGNAEVVRSSGSVTGRPMTEPDERTTSALTDHTRRESGRPSVAYRARVDSAAGRALPALGLDGTVRIVLRPDVGSSAHGAAAPGLVTLFGPPADDLDRTFALLVHELAHVRQHENRGLAGAPAPDVTRAEGEAAGLAAAAAQGRPLWRPRGVLPDGHLARDEGASGVTKAWDTLVDWSEDRPDVAKLESRLETLVALNHVADVRVIQARVEGSFFDLRSEGVEDCLRVLATLPFLVARALVRALPAKTRVALGRMNAKQHTTFPEAAVAVLSAMSAEELKGVAEKYRPYADYHRGVTEALAPVDPSRLGPAARRALLATLRRAGAEVLTALLKSRRPTFRDLLSSTPPGDDAVELEQAIAREQPRSATSMGVGGGVTAADRVAGVPGSQPGLGIVAEQVAGILREPDDAAARDALKVLATLCPKAPAAQPELVTPVSRGTLAAAATSAPANAVGSNAPPEVGAGLVSVVTELERQGSIERLLDQLDSDDRFSADHGWALRCVLAARTPLANLVRATKLLSYGLFDWKVWDAEARFAYLLVRVCPIDAQDAWRRLENGKWFARLTAQMPDESLVNGEYTGVGSEYVVGGAALSVPPAMLDAYAASIAAEWEGRKHAPHAVFLVRELLGRDRSGGARPWVTDAAGQAGPADVPLRTAIVRRLDRRGTLQDIVDKLPDDFLLAEGTRGEVLELYRLRDPVRLWSQALSHLPGWLSWLWFDSRDAWLGTLALRALPPDEQARFAVEHPDVWQKFWSSLTAEQRRAMPSALASGAEQDLRTRDAIRVRLADERLWTEEHALELRALINLAVAADDRRWVFDLSRRLRADLLAKAAAPGRRLAALVADLELYDEAAGRTAYQPRNPAASGAPLWARTIVVGVRGVFGVLVPYALFGEHTLIGRTMKAHAFSLDAVQGALGGDLVPGLTLATGAGGNRIDVDVTFEAGFVTRLRVPRIEIASTNIVRPGATYRTGRATLTDLRITAGFGDRHYTQPLFVSALLGGVDVRDLVVVDAGLPVSPLSAAIVGARSLAFAATQDGTWDAHTKQDLVLPSGMAAFPVPVFGPLFQLLSNIVALTGSVPGDLSPLGIATMFLPTPPGLGGWLFGKARNNILGRIDPTPPLATHLWGLAAEGRWAPPRSATERATDALGMLRAYGVSLASFTVEGLSLGAGTQVTSFEISELHVGINRGGGLSASLRTTAGSLRGVVGTLTSARDELPAGDPKRPELDRRIALLVQKIATLDAQLADRRRELQARLDKGETLTPPERAELASATDLAADEARLTALEAKDRVHPGTLTEKERKELVELTRRRRAALGVTIDIGSVTVGPVTGDIETGGLVLEGVHLQASVPSSAVDLARGYLDDTSLVEQFLAGGPTVPTPADLARTASLSVTVDSTRFVATDPAQPALVVKASTLPPSAEIGAALAAMPEIPGNAGLRARLQAAKDALVLLELRQKAARTSSDPVERAKAEQDVRWITDEARRLLGVEVGGITFGRITGVLDPRTGKASLVVPAVLTDVALPGAMIDRLTGDVEVGVTIGAKPVAPELGLRNVQATGVQLAQGSIGAVSLASLTGSVQRTPKGWRIPDLALQGLVLGTVALGTPANGVTAEQVTVSAMKADVELGYSGEGDARALSSVVVRSLHVASLAGKNLALDSADAEGTMKVRVEQGELRDLRATDVELARGEAGWELVKASASVGAVVDVRYAVALSTLASGKRPAATTTVEGKVESAPTAGAAGPEPAISAAYAVDEKGRHYSLDVRSLVATGTKYRSPDGKVTIDTATLAKAHVEGGDAGLSATATFADLRVGAVSWKVGTGRLSGKGPVTVRRADVAATRDPARKAPWSVTEIDLHDVAASNLTYDDPPMRFEIGGPVAPGVAPLRVGRVRLHPAAGTVRVEDVRASFSGKLSSTLGLQGDLRLASAKVELHENDRVVAVLRGGSGGVTVSGDHAARIDLEGLREASLDISKDAVRLGVELDSVRLSQLRVDTEVSGKRILVTSGWVGGVTLRGVHAKARADRWPPGAAPKGASAFRRVVVERFDIDDVVLSAVQLELPGENLTVSTAYVSASDPVTIRGLSLTRTRGPAGEGQQDFVYDLGTGAVQGTLSARQLSLGATAGLRGKLTNADLALTTGYASIDWLSTGGTRIVVADPALAMKRLVEFPGGRFRVGKLAADQVVVEDGKVTATGSWLEGLDYQSLGPAGHLLYQVKIGRAKAGDLSYTPGPKSPSGKSTFSVPDLEIEEAEFYLDLLRLSPPAPVLPVGTEPPAPAPSSSSEAEFLRPTLAALDGELAVVMFVSADAVGWKDIQIGSTTPLVVPIKDGAVDVATFERNIQAAGIESTYNPEWAGRVGGSAWQVREWVVEGAAQDPLLRLAGDRLQLGVYWFNTPEDVRGKTPDKRPDDADWKPLLQWDLHPVDVKRALGGEFALWSAIFRMHEDPYVSPAKEAVEVRREFAEFDLTDEQINHIVATRRTQRRLESRAMMDSLEIRSLVGNLNVRSSAAIPLTITSASANGLIMLSKDAVMGLTVSGGLPALHTPRVRPAAPANPGALDLALDALAIDSVQLDLKGVGKVETGSIQVLGLRDARLYFDHAHRFTPSLLKGTITKGTATGITWEAP